MLLIFDDGTVHYENQGTNYAGFAPVARGNSISQGLPSTVAGLSFMPQSHPGLHPAALQLPIGYEFAAHAAAAAYGLQQTPQQVIFAYLLFSIFLPTFLMILLT